jgi:hypothetical protein
MVGRLVLSVKGRIRDRTAWGALDPDRASARPQDGARPTAHASRVADTCRCGSHLVGDAPPRRARPGSPLRGRPRRECSIACSEVRNAEWRHSPGRSGPRYAAGLVGIGACAGSVVRVGGVVNHLGHVILRRRVRARALEWSIPVAAAVRGGTQATTTRDSTAVVVFAVAIGQPTPRVEPGTVGPTTFAARALRTATRDGPQGPRGDREREGQRTRRGRCLVRAHQSAASLRSRSQQASILQRCKGDT